MRTTDNTLLDSALTSGYVSCACLYALMCTAHARRKARSRGVPIVMVTSGGYQRSTARIIADSVLNLRDKGLISNDNTDDFRAFYAAVRGEALVV